MRSIIAFAVALALVAVSAPPAEAGPLRAAGRGVVAAARGAGRVARFAGRGVKRAGGVVLRGCR